MSKSRKIHRDTLFFVSLHVPDTSGKQVNNLPLSRQKAKLVRIESPEDNPLRPGLNLQHKIMFVFLFLHFLSIASGVVDVSLGFRGRVVRDIAWLEINIIECLDHRLMGNEHTHYTFDILQHHTTPVVHPLYIFLSRSRMSHCVIQLDIFIHNIWMLSDFTIVQVSSPTITTSAATAKILELEPRLRKDRGCPRFVIFIICLSCLPIILYRWRHAHRPQRQETHHHQHHLWKTLITFTFQPSKLSHTWSSFSTTITKIFFTTTTSSRKEVD